MLSVEAALDRVLARIGVLGAESVPLGAAHRRVLAESVVAGRELPSWDNSSMDGYAVRHVDTAGAAAARPVRLRVVGEIPAGAVAPRALDSGEVYRILTGAPMPAGADAVVPQEAVSRDGEAIVVTRPVKDGDFVRRRGEDIRVGDDVLGPGDTLDPAALGVLAALGRPLVRVYQRPRVAILSTGDELVDLDATPGPGQIPNSNSYTLAAQVQEAGGVPVVLGIAPDDPGELERRFRWGLSADVLVSSAGVSVGDRDFIREVLARLGAELDFWKVSMRPGKPMTFGTLGHRPVFGLPGNPVSSMVTFELFVRPALLKLGGHRALLRPRVRMPALGPMENPGERRGYLRVRVVDEGQGPGVRLTGEQGSAILVSMLRADGLAVLAPDSRVAPGETVEVILLRSDVASSFDEG
ncbi:MAG TPA: gephyrin-like molybdotransferase Glp [Methylomirabilota bacterium]|nr:gephyrin-like molybdotransferase Glp [Methylomirabilota bacterium]